MSAIDDEIGNPFSKELDGCIDDDEQIFSKQDNHAKGKEP